MELVLFTKKRKVEAFVEPILLNTMLHTARSMKYLGVILDAKLICKEHIKQRTSKAFSIFWLYQRPLGKAWGLKPKIVHWFYTSVVRPMLMYAAVV
jgi:hypothetical protein